MPVRVTRIAAALAVVAAGAVLTAQQPRFRAGANLVRVDAYVTADGAPVTDLTIDDFEVLEDNVPQRLESFELIVRRGPASPDVLREPNTVAEARDMAREADARVFVLFMDIWHVQLEGSYRAREPITRLLDQVIGQDDLVGVMTPEMSASTLTLARRRETIAGILKDNWYWGERDRVNSPDPREQEIEACYPDLDDTRGVASEIIARRRNGKTLDALEALVRHLESIREERKFVILLSEGWVLRGPDPSLSRALNTPNGRLVPGGPTPIGVDPGGRLRTDNTREFSSMESCERERSMVAYEDHQFQFQQLLQLANRANVSFYPVDTRGLAVFDAPIGPAKPPPPTVDGARLTARHDALRTLAEVTDGVAIVNTNALDRSLERIVDDTGAYYLLGYYSSNTRLDGRYRRLTVRVKREGVQVRARPGYLAPTEEELKAAIASEARRAADSSATGPEAIVERAWERLVTTRGDVPLRVQVAAAAGRLWLTGEIDGAVSKEPEWRDGGTVRVSIAHEAGSTPPAEIEQPLPAGRASFMVASPSDTQLAPGRHVLRVQITPSSGSLPLQATADIRVPEAAALVGDGALISRRGPATGLAYVPTADARYRRTERLRLEVPRTAEAAASSARLLGRNGQPLNVAIALSDRVDDVTKEAFAVADVTLAPLAPGEYLLELTFTHEDRQDRAAYAFRIVP